MKDHKVNVSLGAKVIVAIIAWLMATGLFLIVSIILRAVYCLMIGQPVMSAWGPHAAVTTISVILFLAAIFVLLTMATTQE